MVQSTKLHALRSSSSCLSWYVESAAGACDGRQLGRLPCQLHLSQRLLGAGPQAAALRCLLRPLMSVWPLGCWEVRSCSHQALSRCATIVEVARMRLILAPGECQKSSR